MRLLRRLARLVMITTLLGSAAALVVAASTCRVGGTRGRAGRIDLDRPSVS